MTKMQNDNGVADIAAGIENHTPMMRQYVSNKI
jgi:hypothetical protein